MIQLMNVSISYGKVEEILPESKLTKNSYGYIRGALIHLCDDRIGTSSYNKCG